MRKAAGVDADVVVFDLEDAVDRLIKNRHVNRFSRYLGCNSKATSGSYQSRGS